MSHTPEFRREQTDIDIATSAANAKLVVQGYLSQLAESGQPKPSREFVKWLITTGLVPVQRKRARKIARASNNLRLHLGCGPNYLQGWVNIDLTRPGRRQDLRWDLRRGLPFGDGTVSAIFSEHLLEHIPLAGVTSLLAEAHRVLKRGGVMRVGVPDLEAYLLSYLGESDFIDRCRPQRPTPALAISEVFFNFGHRSMFDYETIELVCKAAGFTSVERSSFRSGLLGPEADSDDRAAETLYIEATR